MGVGHESQLGQDLARLFRDGLADLGDRALLDRFRANGDPAAFEVLVTRHGPMVQGVCRRLLGSPHDADDAFQATFLVLVRQAGRLRDADRLAPWLYGVASRVATKARSREARRRERTPMEGADLAAPNAPTTDWLDVQPILDAELGQISPKLRAVLVLCLLGGATAEEASRQLECPVGTVKSRLARGREALRDRLIGRGISPALAFTAPTSILAPPVSSSLTRATLGVVTAPSSSLSPIIATLSRGVAPAMISKSTVAVSLVLGGIALAGGGVATWQMSPALAQQPEAPKSPNLAQPPPADKRIRDVSKNHMKQILLAMHNYHSTNNYFPQSAIYGGVGQLQPLLSWRVALLPYLGEEALFKEFRQDEPWDGPHNKALIARMPPVFQTPDSPTPEGQSRIRGFFGKGAMFDGFEAIGVRHVTDGTAHTAMIASAREPIVWTKPGELPFQWDGPLPALDNSDPSESLVGMADGAVLDISPKNEMLLRCMITRSGNEVIDMATLTAADVPPSQVSSAPMTGGMAGMMGGGRAMPSDPSAMIGGGRAMPGDPAAMSRSAVGGAPTAATPDPFGSLAIEKRLQRVEEKLDRLLQKLDAPPEAGKP